MALESFLQQRIRVTRLFQLCQERLFLAIYLEQSFLQLVTRLAELLKLLPVPLVFSAFLSQLPCNLLEFFLQLRVHLAKLLEKLPVSRDFAPLLAEPIELLADSPPLVLLRCLR